MKAHRQVTSNDKNGGPALRDRERAKELAAAQMMALRRLPVSPCAESIISRVQEMVCGWEAKSGNRIRQRKGKTLSRFRDAIAAIVGDLVDAADDQSWVYRSLMAATFTGSLVSYRNFASIMAALEKLSLVETAPGFYRADLLGHGRATRWRPTPKLISLIREAGIAPASSSDHFGQQKASRKGAGEELVLHRSSLWKGGRKIEGASMAFRRSPDTMKLTDEVRRLNDFFDETVVGGAHHRGYVRVFNCGDTAGFRWNKGGRLYSLGKGGYQTLSPRLRKRITLNGESTSEIDIRACNLTILHGLKGQGVLGGDPYQIPDLPREIVKRWILITLGHDRFHTRWPKHDVEELAANGIDLRKFPIDQTRQAIVARYPLLGLWPDLDLDQFDLMFHESQVVIRSLITLMDDHRIPALAMHDGVIVPDSAVEITKRTLTNEFKSQVGIYPTLTVD